MVLSTLIKYINQKKKRKWLNKVLKKQIYREIQKRKQSKINNELKKVKFNELVNKNDITESDVANIKKLNALFENFAINS